jgi:hypothetical protein
MALIDALIKARGLTEAQLRFPQIRDLRVALNPPELIVVTNLFVKVQKPRRSDGEKPAEEQDDSVEENSFGNGPFQASIAPREYVHYSEPFEIALEVSDEQQASWLTNLLVQIAYLGKRGGFVQLASVPRIIEALSEPPFVQLQSTLPASMTWPSIMQVLDDCGPNVSFTQVNIFSGKRLEMDSANGRRLVSVPLPYQLERSSRGFSSYRRVL